MKRYIAFATIACMILVTAGCGGMDGGGSNPSAASSTTITSGFSSSSIEEQRTKGLKSPYEFIKSVEPSILESIASTLDTTDPLVMFGLTDASLPDISLAVKLDSAAAPVPVRMVAPARAPSRAPALPSAGEASPLQLMQAMLDLPPTFSTFALADGSTMTTQDIVNDPLGALYTLIDAGDVEIILRVYPIDAGILESMLDVILQLQGYSSSAATELKTYLKEYYDIG